MHSVRGLCPSCAGHRVAGSAAHLVVRLRVAGGRREAVRLGVSVRAVGPGRDAPGRPVGTVANFLGIAAPSLPPVGAGGGTRGIAGGNRCGDRSASGGRELNVHVHFHVLCLDGVYLREGDAPRFEAASAPTRAELEAMVHHIHARVVRATEAIRPKLSAARVC